MTSRWRIVGTRCGQGGALREVALRLAGHAWVPCGGTVPPVATPAGSPVVLDGILSDEKLAELLALQTEYPELDFKASVDLRGTPGLVELAKDIGAMQVRGGYIIVGVDGHGDPTGDMEGCSPQLFDEANLKAKLVKYLPEPLVIGSRVTERDGHTVVLIWVAPNPLGCAVFAGDGQYQKWVAGLAR